MRGLIILLHISIRLVEDLFILDPILGHDDIAQAAANADPALAAVLPAGEADDPDNAIDVGNDSYLYMYSSWRTASSGTAPARTCCGPRSI